MKLIKSDRRTTMKEKTLADSLMISLESPSIKDFNPEEAIDIWFTKCTRGPGSSQSAENKTAAEVASAVIEDIDNIEDNNEEVANIVEQEMGDEAVAEHGVGFELVEDNDSDLQTQTTHQTTIVMKKMKMKFLH